MRLSEEQRMLRDTARDVARDLLAPHAADWDRDARFPQEALAELGRLGFMGMLVPAEYGGARADPVGYGPALGAAAARIMSAMRWRWRRPPPETARSRPSSRCIIRSAACRCCATARRSRNSAF